MKEKRSLPVMISKKGLWISFRFSSWWYSQVGLYHDQFTFFIQAAVSDFGFRSSEVLSLGFWSKMILHKLISELSIRELKTVFVRTGRRGAFLESSAIIQLTIFLIMVGQDPSNTVSPFRYLITGDPMLLWSN